MHNNPIVPLLISALAIFMSVVVCFVGAVPLVALLDGLDITPSGNWNCVLFGLLFAATCTALNVAGFAILIRNRRLASPK